MNMGITISERVQMLIHYAGLTIEKLPGRILEDGIATLSVNPSGSWLISGPGTFLHGRHLSSLEALLTKPEPHRPCPCGQMTIDDCAGECGHGDRRTA